MANYFFKCKVRAMENVRDCLRFKKFFHHRVQRVVQPRKTCFFVDRKKLFLAIRDFSVFGVFPEKPVFSRVNRNRNSRNRPDFPRFEL